MQNDKLLNYLHLHFIVFIWGFTAVLGALITLEAIPLVWYRMLLATGFVFLYLKIKKENLRFSMKTLGGFALAGIIIALHWLTFFGAIKASNVSVTLAVISTGAFFTSLLEPLLYGRKIIWYEVFFGLLVMVGLYIIFDVEASYTLGIVLALISAFLSALFSVINGKFVLKHKASAISFYELLFGVIGISIYLAISGSFTTEFFSVSTHDWMYLAILASGCTAYAFIASIHVMKWISPYTVMLTINMEPVYGIILALLVLGDAEKMGSQFYYGAIIILLTVIANGIIKITQERKRKRLSKT
ncbi:DMT family transporter [Aequorivita viscosa]|uniref:EamA-like transporter family protein n=1 Tax=Aequorivita viscosa TaxID=797419 RepID=A0A1M6F0J4_9FLAO|nr:DMT family transporter [Aequorivita viscosa]SDW63636.1 EamA-like transporter family protein [Aequorivita viscosa]SHI91212.1 EamA-like transporter family protein [Aequorivita viscosa]